MNQPPRPERPAIRAVRRRLLLAAAGLGLSMAGGLAVALTATDRLVRSLGLVVLFLATTLLAPLVGLWRQWRAERQQPGA